MLAQLSTATCSGWNCYSNSSSSALNNLYAATDLTNLATAAPVAPGSPAPAPVAAQTSTKSAKATSTQNTNPGVVENHHLSTTTSVDCKDFVFNFHDAHITGNVIINIPGVGEIFCGEAGNVSGGSHYTNKTTSTAKNVIYNAHKTANGSYNLQPVHVSAAVYAAYLSWIKIHPNPVKVSPSVWKAYIAWMAAHPAPKAKVSALVMLI